MRTKRSSAMSARAAQQGWLGSTSALGQATLAVLAFGAAAFFWKQLPDLRRYLKIRSM